MTDQRPGAPREDGLFGPGGAKFVVSLLALLAIAIATFALTSTGQGEEDPALVGALRAPEPRPLTPEGADSPPDPRPGGSGGAAPESAIPDLSELPEGVPPAARRAIELGRKRFACIRDAEGDVEAIGECIERFAP